MQKKFLIALFALFACCAFSQAHAVCNISECSGDCPECEFCGQDCTLTQGFWKNHTECWPIDPNSSEAEFCNIDWTTILDTPTQGRPWYILAHQAIAAALNDANGATVDCNDVEEALEDALDLLTNNCQDINSQFPPDRDEYIDLAALLDDFNNGRLQNEGCPAHCGGTGSTACVGCLDCDLCCPCECDCNDCPFDCDLCSECPPENCPPTRTKRFLRHR